MTRLIAIVFTLEVVIASPAFAFDPFGAMRDVSSSPASRMLGGSESVNPCAPGELSAPLLLFEAISRALCQSPKARQAWANVTERAAAVGADDAAYLPALAGAWQDQKEYSATKVRHRPDLDTSDRALIFSGSLTLGWVLYDFGNREATIEGARQLFLAAQANLDEDLQQVFMQAAQDYYAAQAIHSILAAAIDVESNAKLSQDAAQVRVEKGIAPISDQLQAQTAYAQAVLNRVKSEGELRIRLGTLAIDMGLDPDTPIVLTDAWDNANPGPEFIQSARALVEQAKLTHPSIVAAEHQLSAAAANERIARAQAYPSIRLISKSVWGDQPTIPGLGVNPVPAADRDSYIGVQVQVPLFDGFARHYQIEQAKAQVEIQRSALDDVEQQVARDVWVSYQTLKSDTDNLVNVESVLVSAQGALKASEQRYLGGAGTILELLAVQSALANARQQRIQALSEWRTARLQLAGSLGKLGLWAIDYQGHQSTEAK